MNFLQMISNDNEDNEEYFIPEKNGEKKIKINGEDFNPKCRCPELTCPRHSNCRECRKFHNNRLELTYCGK